MKHTTPSSILEHNYGLRLFKIPMSYWNETIFPALNKENKWSIRICWNLVQQWCIQCN